MKLTTQEIARYRPPEGKADHIVFDDGLSGFGLRYRDGRKTWVFQYAFGTGESRTNARMTLGEYPALSPTKARDIAQALYAKVRLGQAAGYLVTADLSIESIAMRTGYASSASLSKAFKREFGVSPGHYRRCRGDVGELSIR